MREWILRHGWGYDAGAWDAFAALIPPTDRVLRFDRGYTGAPADPRFTHPDIEARILVTHSMGITFTHPEVDGACGTRLILGGFDRFHGHPTGIRVTERMRERLRNGDAGVLREFHAACGDPGRGGYERPWNWDLLIDDLHRLDRWRAGDSMMNLPGKIAILHARADRIVPVERGQALAELAGVPLRILDGVGHSFPYVAPDRCMDF